MKKLILFIALIITFNACNDYLDVVPDNVATLDYAFRNKVSAEKYLTTCYSYLPYFGYPQTDPAIMGSDEIWSHEDEWYYQWTGGNFNAFNIKKGYQNVTEPLLNFFSGLNGPNLWQGIRDCNIFLENIGKVPDMEEYEKRQWSAEVKFLKAYFHYYLLRAYGPIPIIRENLSTAAEIDEVRVYREPVDDCMDYIVALINEAVPDLPLTINNATTEYGRITQPIALAVKAEALMVAASPLFNGNNDYANITDSRGIKLFNPEKDITKWERAMNACKDAIDTALLAGHRLYEFNNSKYDLSEPTKLAMTLRNVFAEWENPEIIWKQTRAGTTTNLQRLSLPYFKATDIQYYPTNPTMAPTLGMAELFYSSNGVPIEEDLSYAYTDRYETAASSADQKYYIKSGFQTAILNQNREARFYANLGFDGALWFGNGRYSDVEKGNTADQPWVMAMKRGETTGRNSSIRFSITGYYPKKWSHFESVTSATGTLSLVTIGFPIIRLADLYLLYAEARNEFSGPNAEVEHYVDLVRERAGLKGVTESWAQHSRNRDKPATQEGMRKIIQQERMIELAFEGKRFWDIRRWKIADDLLNKPVRGWNIEGTTTDDYYNVVTLWPMEFTTKEYLWPIKEATLRANPNLIQNPYW